MEDDDKVFGEEGDTEEKTPSDKTVDNEEGEGDKGDEEKDSKKPERSDIAQKIKYREKYQAESRRTRELEAELAKLKDLVKKPADDAEARAQEYIRKQAREVYEELQTAREADKQKQIDAFREKLDDVLEENPDISQEELMETCEEYEVEPSVALKILKKTSSAKPKPKMPQSKRAAETEKPVVPDDSKKTMWQILQEEASKFKK